MKFFFVCPHGALRSKTKTPTKELLDELVELTLMAEKSGFLKPYGLVEQSHDGNLPSAPNPLNFMAYLAPLTKTIRLGLGHYCGAIFGNPVSPC